MSESRIPETAPEHHFAWQKSRWDEVAGPMGKLAVVVLGEITGSGPQTVPGAPGQWAITETGELTVTATAQDGLRINGELVDGTVPVPANVPLGFPDGRTGFAGGANGAYGLAAIDPEAVQRSGLTGIDAYPYDPAWVFEGRLRAAEEGRRLTLNRLGDPSTVEAFPAPADLVVTVRGQEFVLPLVEDLPGRLLLIFTDLTNGTETPTIGRWLVLPPLDAGSSPTIDFNQASLPHHLLSAEVFTCPAAPTANHLPVRVEAGERAFTRTAPAQPEGSTAMSSQNLTGKATAFLRNLQNRDWAAARALCADNATVWHSDGKGDSGIDENIRSMAEGMDGIESIEYTITRQLASDEDVLQQHVLDVTTSDGAHVQINVAARFGFTDGLISRIEEYGSAPAGLERS
ncbi:uncharacterized protein (DUF1684 family)/limonene-1,2-epoxide hydrolase [Crossiella equi]|uniref:Uncharacterized protein (DUF1684 family)/limonene-1,2-epoxide hydrolase n=1 Tax=Crossiella equi TaxID=130796 RepID=A0ABS5A6V7_9PSEU|nr:DUF1684 domain-containing protein [Crossiella equi]MBP2472334.1 uncharacterized protein (DUF1684 family)/limonene-1,2-epoxide hydrolase [Crossiella equi]